MRSRIKVPKLNGNRDHVSPLRYPGGKTCLVPLFKRVIKANSLEDVTYVEPYAGGAGAALSLLYGGYVNRIVINDFNPAIYAFWVAVTSLSQEFLAKLASISVNVDEWEHQRKIYHDPGASMLDKGFATFFLNRTNVSGIMDGGPIGRLDQSGKWKIDARFNKETLFARLKMVGDHAGSITVKNENGVDVIKSYLGEKNTLIYLDPPYFEKGSTLYLNSFTLTDHQDLAELLNKHSDQCWLLTYDNKRKIRKLYANRRIANFTIAYRAHFPRNGREILVMADSICV